MKAWQQFFGTTSTVGTGLEGANGTSPKRAGAASLVHRNIPPVIVASTSTSRQMQELVGIALLHLSLLSSVTDPTHVDAQLEGSQLV